MTDEKSMMNALVFFYRQAGMLSGNHKCGWSVKCGKGWRTFSTRHGALSVLRPSMCTEEYKQAGQFMEQGLLKGSHGEWWAKSGDEFVKFPSLREALDALNQRSCCEALDTHEQGSCGEALDALGVLNQGSGMQTGMAC